jgi:hypothetical protein
VRQLINQHELRFARKDGLEIEFAEGDAAMLKSAGVER